MEGRPEACSKGLGGNTWKDPSKELGAAAARGPSANRLWKGPGQVAVFVAGLESRSQVRSNLIDPD